MLVKQYSFKHSKRVYLAPRASWPPSRVCPGNTIPLQLGVLKSGQFSRRALARWEPGFQRFRTQPQRGARGARPGQAAPLPVLPTASSCALALPGGALAVPYTRCRLQPRGAHGSQACSLPASLVPNQGDNPQAAELERRAAWVAGLQVAAG